MSKGLTSPSAYKPKPPHEDEYEVRSAMENMAKAEEHKRDPKMMAAVQKMAKKKAKDFHSIAQLRAHREAMSGMDPEEEGETAEDNEGDEVESKEQLEPKVKTKKLPGLKGSKG